MISINEVADYFLLCTEEESGDVITHLKLQKLTYYSQAWHLAVFNGDPCVDNDFQAWAHGPVCPELYERFSESGFQPILRDALLTDGPADEEKNQFLKEVWEVYGGHSAKALERLTHSEDPWIEARGNLGPLERSDTVISKASMQDYYSKQLVKK